MVRHGEEMETADGAHAKTWRSGKVRNAADIVESLSPAPRRRRGTTILFVGDPHFESGNREMTDTMHADVVRLTRATRPNAVVVLGDTLHRNTNIDSRILVRAVAFLSALAEITTLVLIAGNHDLPGPADFMSGVHGFTALAKWPNTILVDRVCRFRIGTLDVVAAPYVKTGELHSAFCVSGTDVRGADLVISHQEYRGCKLGGAAPSTEGDVWPADYPLNVSGHIHDRCWLQDNLLYTGMAYMHRRTDTRDKGLSLLVWDEQNVFRLEQRFRIASALRSHIDLAADDALAWHPPEGAEGMEVVLRGTQEELEAVREAGLLASWRSAGVKVVEKPRIASGERYKSVVRGGSFTETLTRSVGENGGELAIAEWEKLRRNIQ